MKTIKQNVTLSIGSLALIEKVDGQYQYFKRTFGGIGGRAKNLVNSAKLFSYNRLTDCLSINRLKEGYSEELFRRLNFKEIPGTRSFYRDLERIGANQPFLQARHSIFLKEEQLNVDTQFIDFSSSYFEGKGGVFGERGYSRDGQPGKKQLTFGISTGINSIPAALTIQKGNVQDKEHFQFMLKACEAVLEEGSLLIFDCGGNTKKNKAKIKELKFNYITLKPKQKAPYKRAIEIFNAGTKTVVSINSIEYQCVKSNLKDETNYIFFSKKLKELQIELKGRKFRRELEKNKSILKKTKSGKDIGEYITEEGIVTAKGKLQTLLGEIENTKITGLEGYFILESNLDLEPKRVLALYKDKDKAEKLFRSIKEGTELRPIRHWSTNAIIGYIWVIFLTNFLVNLTLLRAKDSVVKNTKLLKKYLNRLTLTVIYPPTGFKFSVLANICPEIVGILGDFIEKYRDKSLPMRW